MKKISAAVIAIVMTTGVGIGPASAAKCAAADIESVRSFFVPILRLSAHQGRNVEENREVVSNLKQVTKFVSSPKLKESLKNLRGVIEQGGLNKGSTDYWGYRDGSAWKTYKIALTITQKSHC